MIITRAEEENRRWLVLKRFLGWRYRQCVLLLCVCGFVLWCVDCAVQSFVSFILTCIFWALIVFPLWNEAGGEVGLAEGKKESSRERKERIRLKRETNDVLLLLINHFFIYLGSLRIFMVNGSPLNLFKIHCGWNLCCFFLFVCFVSVCFSRFKLLGSWLRSTPFPSHSESSSCAFRHLLIPLLSLMTCQCCLWCYLLPFLV